MKVHTGSGSNIGERACTVVAKLLNGIVRQLPIYSKLVSTTDCKETGCDFGVGSYGEFALAKVTVVPPLIGVVGGLSEIVGGIHVIDTDLELDLVGSV